MYKKMLVLLDGSKLSEATFSYASELAGRLSLNLDLLIVSNQPDNLPMCQAYIERKAENLRAQSEEIRKNTGSKLGTRMIVAKGTAVVGYPAEEILKYADNNKVDIIMLSTHGTSGIRRWGLGSIADKVIHETKIPVWLVPAQLREEIIHDKMPQRLILVPLDGSKSAEAVVPHVEELINQRGIELEILLITVRSKPISMTEDEAKKATGEDVVALQTAGEIYLRGIANELQKKGYKVQAEELVGDPAEEIVRYAAHYNPLIICMSTHGYTGFNRFLFGHVTENVLRRLQKTPLFLIRPNKIQIESAH